MNREVPALTGLAIITAVALGVSLMLLVILVVDWWRSRR